MSSSIDDASWFRVLLAVRWPCALVASSAVLGGVLLHVLSRPIPIRLAMPLDQPLAVKAEVAQLSQPIRVEQLSRAIEIAAKDVLTVRGLVGIEHREPVPITHREPVPITGQPRVVVTNPVEVKASSALPVKGSVDVTAGQPLPVKGDVEVATPAPLKVETDVKLDTEDNPVQVQVKEGLMGIF